MSNYLQCYRLLVRQPPLSLGFSRKESWSGLPCPPPGDLPHPGIGQCLLRLFFLHWQADTWPLALLEQPRPPEVPLNYCDFICCNFSAKNATAVGRGFAHQGTRVLSSYNLVSFRLFFQVVKLLLFLEARSFCGQKYADKCGLSFLILLLYPKFPVPAACPWCSWHHTSWCLLGFHSTEDPPAAPLPWPTRPFPQWSFWM